VFKVSYDVYNGTKTLYRAYYVLPNVTYKQNLWYEASKTRISRDFPFLSYKSGFHIFEKWRDARRLWVNGAIFKVEYQEAHTRGKQYGGEVIVANKMRILGMYNRKC